MKHTALLHFIGALLLLLVVGGLNVVWYNTVQGEGMQASSLAGEIQAHSNASARAAQAKVELSALASDQATMEQYFVSTNNVVPFLEELQSTGSYLGSGVQIASVSASPGTPYGTLDLSLSISGSFNAIMRTLGSIEYGPYDTTISTLSLDTQATVTGSSSPEWVGDATFTVGTEAGAPIAVPAASTSASTTTASTTPSVVAPSAVPTPTP